MAIRNLVNCVVLQKFVHQSVHSVRFYGRWMHRNPAKVILPFEHTTSKVNLKNEKVIELDPAGFNKSTEKQEPKNILQSRSKVKSEFSSEKSQEMKTKRDQQIKKRNFYLSQQKVFDDNQEIIFEKLKDNDGRISTLITNLKSKKERQRTKQMLVEGWRLIVDGLQAKCRLKYVIFSKHDDINNMRPFLPKTGVKFFKIPYKEICLWSDVETSPGILGIFEMPSQENVQRLSKPLPLHFICDNIRVPGNVGAILRVAVGAGCDQVFLTKGCVDLWEPKVIRSAAGAHFRLPIHYGVDWEDMPKLLEQDTSVFVADSNARIDNDEQNIDEMHNQMPVLPYYGVEYSSMPHITLILGGETEGISEESYRFAASRNGLRINIPLQKGVDSLNTGMATAVIAFEIRKQLIQAWTRIKMERKTLQAT